MELPRIDFYGKDLVAWGRELITALERKFDQLAGQKNAPITVETVVSLNGLRVDGLAEYADNAEAVADGLMVGTFYRTGDVVKVVHT